MNVPSMIRRVQRLAWPAIAGVTAVALLLTSVLVTGERPVLASSHREAPLISQDAFADNTDTYAFVSPTNPNNLVLVASWIPFEGPEGGPNYFEWGKDVLYDINVDNNGDAKPDFTYTLSSATQVQNPLTFLYNVGPIGSDGNNWNRQQRYTITETSAGGVKTLLNNVLAPPVNIGSKSTPNYATFSDKFIYTVNDGADQIKVYAGQTDDAFWVDLQVFDLLTLRNQQPPVGYSIGNNSPVDSVAGFNVHSLVLEVPISRLTANGDPVLGVWATARRPALRVLNGPAGLGTLDNSGSPVQVSRLGMPLTNEVVLPYALKDAFNSIAPEVDSVLYTGGAGTQVRDILQKSVEDPEIGNLLCSLYGVPLPGDANRDCKTEVMLGTPRSGRGDIFDIFLRGMVLAAPFTINTKNGPVTLPAGFNVNRPANVVPADMLRINTAIKGDLCSPKPSRLGILGGDACGFPNGRRLTDDTVEIELLAVAGAAYPVLDGRDAGFAFNPALIGVLDDGVYANDQPFRPAFPYMALAQSGQEHIHQNPQVKPQVTSVAVRIVGGADDAEEKQNGELAINSPTLELGQIGSKGRTVGLRFANLAIPAGATILDAYVQFYAARSQSEATTLIIRGDAADDAAGFERSRFNLTRRTLTASAATWSNVPAWKAGEPQWSASVAPVVQEIVARPGWATGNDLALLVTGTGSRTAIAYDGLRFVAPALIVTYSVDGKTATVAAGAEDGSLGDQVTNVIGSSVLLGSQVVPEVPAVDDDEASTAAPAAVDGPHMLFLPLAQKGD